MTIPKPLRDRLGIRPGHVLELRDDHGRLVATKTRLDDPYAAVYGILDSDRRTDELVGDLRGEPDAV